MYVRREWVFETNSSSSHSVTIGESGIDVELVPQDGTIYVHFWDYGREVESYRNIYERISYVATYLFWAEGVWVEDVVDGQYVGSSYNVLSFEKLLMDRSGATEVRYDIGSSGYEFWYIDHQSWDVWQEAYENMEDFIFDRDSCFNTDNDNN